MNLASLLFHHAQNQPKKVALTQHNRNVDYQEFWIWISSTAAGLIQAGIKPGDRVGLCLSDHIDHLTLLFAIAAIGATVLPMDHRWSPAEKKQIAEAFKARLVIREANEENIAGVSNLLLAEILGEAPPDSAESPSVDLYDDDDIPFLVALSSGTTGRPKGALVSHRHMYERFVNQWNSLNFTSDDSFVSVTPLYFGAARSLCMGFLSLGAKVVIDAPPHKPHELKEAIQRSGANIAFLVPTLMRRLLSLTREKQLMFPGLDLLVFGGSSVHGEEALEIQKRLTPNLANYYATSEGGGISVLRANEIALHGDTVGRAASGITVEIVDTDNTPVAQGESGRLRYRGPGVATVFLNESGELDDSGSADWFYPGDLASIDAKGYITLRGREKEMIIRGGINLYPAEIESVLREHPSVNEAAVIGVPSKTMGENVVAIVANSSRLKDSDLLEYCKSRLAPYKVPNEILFVNELPKTNFGKIDKPTIAERLLRS